MHFIGTITAGPGAAANNATATGASLDLATKTTHVDTVIESLLPGNDTIFTMIGDAANAGGGVRVVVDQEDRIVTVHYEDGITRVAELEAAIAALAGGDKIIDVKTPGTAGHLLSRPVDDVVPTAIAGSSSFSIPPTCKAIYLQSDTSGVQFEFGAGDAFATTADRGAFLPTLKTPYGPFHTGGSQPVISVWNPTGGSAKVNVYRAPY